MKANIQYHLTQQKYSNQLKKTVNLCLMVGSMSSMAYAATAPDFYVATTGSDSRTIAQAQNKATPWKTIQKAGTTVPPGSVVHVAPGTYSTSNTRTLTTTTIKKSGTATAHITFISDTKWGARIVGQAYEALLRVDGQYVDVKNFEIIGTGPVKEGILVTNSNVQLIGNKIHDLIGPGIETWTDNYNLGKIDILDNLIYAVGKKGDGQHGIYAMHQGGRIANNVIFNTPGYGIHTWHAATGLVISNNLVFNNGQGGITVGAGDAPYNRVADNFVVTNNIAAFNGSYGINENGKLGRNNVYRNNLVYQNGEKDIYLKVSTAQNTITKNPGLIPLGAGLYGISSTSPAINAGTQLGAAATDILGKARTGNPDIGPHEVSGTTATTVAVAKPTTPTTCTPN